MTEFSNANACNADLDQDLKKTRDNLKTAQAAAQEARKSVYFIQGAVSDMACQMDDSLQTAVEKVLLRVDSIEMHPLRHFYCFQCFRAREQTTHPHTHKPALVKVYHPLWWTSRLPNQNKQPTLGVIEGRNAHSTAFSAVSLQISLFHMYRRLRERCNN